MFGPKSSQSPGVGGMSQPGGGESAMDEQSVMSAMSGGSSGLGTGSSSQNSSSGAKNQSSQSSQSPASQPPKPKEPREVGTISEEVRRGAEDTWAEVKQFFSINTWLGIDPESIDPEEQAKAQEFHARYQQLDQEQQAVAKQMHQEKMQKKKMQEEEDEHKKKVEAQEKAQSVSMPSSPQKGAKGQGGGKQRAMQKLQRDRTTMSTTQGE